MSALDDAVPLGLRDKADLRLELDDGAAEGLEELANELNPVAAPHEHLPRMFASLYRT